MRARERRAWSGNPAQAILQPVDAVEIELRASPLQDLDRLEIVVFELVHKLLVERLHVGRHAKCAVVQVTTGAAGDLGELGGRQIAMDAAVEFAEPAKAM